MSTPPVIRLINISNVEAMTGLRKSKLYDLIQDGTFPAPRRVTSRASRWIESEVADWCEGLPVGTVPSISPGARRRDAAAALAALREQVAPQPVADIKAPREQRDPVVRRKPERPRKHVQPTAR